MNTNRTSEMDQAESEYVNATEAARLVGVDRRTIIHHMEAGRLPAEPVPNKLIGRRIRRADLDKIRNLRPGVEPKKKASPYLADLLRRAHADIAAFDIRRAETNYTDRQRLAQEIELAVDMIEKGQI